MSVSLVKMIGECTSHTDKGALLDDAPRPSNAQPRGRRRGCEKYSVKSKATQILSATLKVISPCMRRLFVDRQYSPSTGMDLCE
jgi:hypothetical protein